MRQIFRHGRTKEIVDEIKHTIEVLKSHSKEDVRVYVGTDSQNKRRKTVYATVIAFRYGVRGAHYIYSMDVVKKIPDSKRFLRLWQEVEKSLYIARRLRDAGIHIHAIDLDYNKKETSGSHMMLASGRGYVTGEGFNVTTKPDEQVACKAADHLVGK